jgi:hypothetical protein
MLALILKYFAAAAAVIGHKIERRIKRRIKLSFQFLYDARMRSYDSHSMLKNGQQMKSCLHWIETVTMLHNIEFHEAMLSTHR